MTSILCLAHFCEVHGPTPLMVTEGLPVKCNTCDDQHIHDVIASVTAAAAAAVTGKGTGSVAASPSSTSTTHTAATAAVATATRNMNLESSQREALASEDPTCAQHSSSSRKAVSATSSPREPQLLPKSATSSPRPSSDSGSHFRKTYDESVTKRAIPCDNCAMTLPRRKQDAGSGSPRDSARNPTLRTRVPCARVYDGAAGDVSPLLLHPSSSSASSSTSSDTEGDEKSSPHQYSQRHQRSGTMNSVTSRSSFSSSTSRLTNSHTHYLDYTSTHEPVAPNAYSVVRASCLRTLTLEILPRSPAAAGGSGGAMSPQPSFSYHLNPHSAASAAAAAAATSAANGSPLFFGDPSAGYTTAHVFRVADVHARGHKRVYALIALNTHRERLAMKAFSLVSAAFSELATWIQQLADAEAERVALQSESTAASSPSGAGSPLTCTSPTGYTFGGSPQPQVSPPLTRASSVANDLAASGGSSFLAAAGNGLSRRMGPGFAGFGGLGSSTVASLRARGLPEILGMPDFFIELHARFVRLLLELGVTLNA